MSEDSGYNMAMPFVVCESNGGPHGDAAFVAGFECGVVDSVLSSMAAADPGYRGAFGRYVHAASVLQLDLIAMRHGFMLELTKYDDEWTFANFYEAEILGVADV